MIHPYTAQDFADAVSKIGRDKHQPLLSVLTGPPCCDKTALMNSIGKLCEKRATTVLSFDLRDFVRATEEEFHEMLLDSLLTEAQYKGLRGARRLMKRPAKMWFADSLRGVLRLSSAPLLLQLDHIETVPRMQTLSLLRHFRSLQDDAGRHVLRLSALLCGILNFNDLKTLLESPSLHVCLILRPAQSQAGRVQAVRQLLRSEERKAPYQLMEDLSEFTAGESSFLLPVLNQLRKTPRWWKDPNCLAGLNIEPGAAQFPQLDHLAMHWWLNPRLKEIVHDLVTHKYAERSDDAFFGVDAAELSGVVTADIERPKNFRFRNGIVKRYFERLVKSTNGDHPTTPEHSVLGQIVKLQNELQTVRFLDGAAGVLGKVWPVLTGLKGGIPSFYLLLANDRQADWWIDPRHDGTAPNAHTAHPHIELIEAVREVMRERENRITTVRSEHLITVLVYADRLSMAVVAGMPTSPAWENPHTAVLTHWRRFVEWATPILVSLALAEIGGDAAGLSRPVSLEKRRKVYVVHGRDLEPTRVILDMLQEFGLLGLDWDDAVRSYGKSVPSVFQVLDHVFEEAQAVLILFTQDEEACLKEEFRNPSDTDADVLPGPQSRPNVIFEAGMAMGRHIDQTILIKFGRQRPISDLGGLHFLNFEHADFRTRFAERLEACRCDLRKDLSRSASHSRST